MAFTLPEMRVACMQLRSVNNNGKTEMPIKSGKVTHKERAFAAAYAETGNQGYAAKKAGYVGTGSASMALQRPAIQAEIARIQTERLFNEVLPLAVKVHIDLLQNPATPAGARVQAVKLAYDRTLGTDASTADKQPHEMTAEEIAKALAEARLRAATLESVKADRAKPVIDASPGVLD